MTIQQALQQDDEGEEGGHMVTELGRDDRDEVTVEHKPSRFDITQFETRISIQLDVSIRFHGKIYLLAICHNHTVHECLCLGISLTTVTVNKVRKRLWHIKHPAAYGVHWTLSDAQRFGFMEKRSRASEMAILTGVTRDKKINILHIVHTKEFASIGCLNVRHVC